VLYGGASPVPEIVRSGHLLQNMGADVLVMPCNTSHYFYEEIAASLEIPLLHMIRETADVLHRRGIRRAGLMATDGLIRSGLYARLFEAQGIELLIPDDVHQKAVMRMIYENVKGGCFELDTTAFQETARQLLDNGAQTLVLGCTELPVAMQHYGFDFPHIDPTLVLASRAVQFTGTKVREEFLY
jgi:aspartate racemase